MLVRAGEWQVTTEDPKEILGMQAQMENIKKKKCTSQTRRFKWQKKAPSDLKEIKCINEKE